MGSSDSLWESSGSTLCSANIPPVRGIPRFLGLGQHLAHGLDVRLGSPEPDGIPRGQPGQEG